MVLYPAAMSDPDRNPNFRRRWTEPIGPPKRKAAQPRGGGLNGRIAQVGNLERFQHTRFGIFCTPALPAPVNGSSRATRAERRAPMAEKNRDRVLRRAVPIDRLLQWDKKHGICTLLS